MTARAGAPIEYAIVGSAEANPAENKLSNESPVGRAILGHKKGETVEVAAPRGDPQDQELGEKAPVAGAAGGASGAGAYG